MSKPSSLRANCARSLGLTGLKALRIVNRYDVEGISQELFDQTVPTVFSEPQVDNVAYDLPDFAGAKVFATEFLPGQFDQRADSAAECIQLISQGERPTVRSAKLYALEGDLTDADVDTIKHYVINPVEAREASLETKETLKTQVPVPGKVETIAGFQRDGRRSRPEVHRRARSGHGSGRPRILPEVLQRGAAATPPSPRSR